jgi:membrane protease YdiL (CAAX protease family)
MAFAGISLFYATYKFRNISIAVGMHFSWNFLQGVVLPFQGSGQSVASYFILVGGKVIFPEASHFMFISILLEMLIITLISRVKCFSRLRKI